MTTTAKNPLNRLEQPKRNYAVPAVSALLFLLLLGGIALSVFFGFWQGSLVFVVSTLVFLVIVLLHQANLRRIAAIDDRKFIRWDTAMPEIQRQNVNIEVRELARLLSVGEDQLTDLLSAYIVAEDLALRQIQQEENLPLLRHVSIAGIPFDGILVDHDLITSIEVSFLVTPDLRQERIEAILKKTTQAKTNLVKMKSRLRLRLMLVLVTQLSADEDERLRGALITRRFSDTPVDIDIRMLDFETLQKVYVSE